VILGLAVALDGGFWLGFWLFFATIWPAASFEEAPENLPSVDLTFGDPELPIVDSSAPPDQRPLQARALAQNDAAPVRETRRLAPPGPSQKSRPLALAAATPVAAEPRATPPTETPAPPAREEPSENLPLVESTEEVIPELPLDRHSAIATQGSALAAYLDGIRRAVRAGWRPSAVFGRGSSSADLRISGRTELKVRVRADGGLEDASVLNASGLPALDNEAVAAFARTEPFRPVPAELLDLRGGLSFRFALHLDLDRARFLRAAVGLLRAAWFPPDTRGPMRSKVRVAVVLVRINLDGGLSHTSLEIPSDLDEVNRTALDLVARVRRFPPPPDSLRVAGQVAQFRASILLRPRGSDELRVFSGAP
jgi:TonB family protein